MKKKISLGGYKAIGEIANLNLAPITLLIGPNGSGKSSVVNMVRAVENIVSEQVDKIENTLFGLIQLEWKKEELLEFSKSIFGVNKLTYNVFDFLENPAGKFFKPEDFNKDLKEKKILLNFPIFLDFFSDKFEVRFSYSLRDNSLLGIDSVEIININSGNRLMSVSMVVDFTTSNPNKKTVRKYYSANIFLDVNFVLNEIKNKSIELSKKKPFVPFDWNSNNALLEGLVQEVTDSMMKDSVEAEKESGQIQDNLKTPFNVAEKCVLNNDESYNSPKKMSYNFIRMIDFLKGDGLMFDYAKQNEGNEQYNENSQLTAKKDFEREFLKKIESGNFNTIPWDFPALSIFLDRLDVSDSVLEKNEISKLSLNVLGMEVLGLSPFGDFIINQMIFGNFRNCLGGLKNYFGDHKFIGVDRLREKKNSVGNFSDAQEFLEDILSQKGLGVDETPSLDFLNYHLKQFGMDMIGDYSSLAEYYDVVFNGNNIKGVIGYGHEMLISIISKLALPSQYVDIDNLAILYGSDYQGMSAKSVREMFFGKGRLFIIEEPESNLHPNNQTKLADLFIDAAWKFGHQFLIETHSEYLVRKLQFYIASGKIKSEDVQIYYFDKDKNNEMNIVSINILNDGSLSKPFSSGFFDESDRISLELFIARKNNMN